MFSYKYGPAGGPIGVEPAPSPENAVDHPTGFQRQDQGAIPLIAHLIWTDREEWRAVTARNWTKELVMVTWPPTSEADGGTCWLCVEDVTRVMVTERGSEAHRAS